MTRKLPQAIDQGNLNRENSTGKSSRDNKTLSVCTRSHGMKRELDHQSWSQTIWTNFSYIPNCGNNLHTATSNLDFTFSFHKTNFGSFHRLKYHLKVKT